MNKLTEIVYLKMQYVQKMATKMPIQHEYHIHFFDGPEFCSNPLTAKIHARAAIQSAISHLRMFRSTIVLSQVIYMPLCLSGYELHVLLFIWGSKDKMEILIERINNNKYS